MSGSLLNYIICTAVSKRQHRKPSKSTQERERNVSKPVAFSCLEYLITTTKQILAWAIGKCCRLDSKLFNLKIRISKDQFSATVLSINYKAKTHVENKCFKLSFSCMWDDWMHDSIEALSFCTQFFIPKCNVILKVRLKHAIQRFIVFFNS